MTLPAPEIITPKSGELFDQQVKLAWTKTHPFLFYYYPGFSNILVERGTEGTYISKSGRMEVADPDTPRITWRDSDGDGVRETPALLLEPQRTNLVPSPRLDTDSDGDGFPDGVVASAHADYAVTPLSMSDGTFTFRVERIADTGGWGGGIRINIPGIVQGDVLSSGIDILVTPGSTPLVGATRCFWEYTDDATGQLVTIPAVQYPADGQWHRLLIENATIEQVVRANTLRLIVRSGGGASDPIGGAVTVSVRRPQIERGPTASSFMVGTRAPDLAVADVTEQFAGRRSFALYQRFEERGTIVIRNWARVLSLESDEGTIRIWAPGSGAATYEAHVGSGLYAKIPSGTPALHQTVEHLMIVAEDGTLTLAQSIDGGPVVTATGSHGGFVPTGRVRLAWGSTVSGSNHGALAGRDLLVLDGSHWTMEQVREVISDLDWYRRRESTIYR